jgi:hypothetical protein
LVPSILRRAVNTRLPFTCAAAVAETAAAAAAAGVRLQPSPEVVELLRSADAFTFDVDSTL